LKQLELLTLLRIGCLLCIIRGGIVTPLPPFYPSLLLHFPAALVRNKNRKQNKKRFKLRKLEKDNHNDELIAQAVERGGRWGFYLPIRIAAEQCLSVTNEECPISSI
jgi:hypothetical protein